MKAIKPILHPLALIWISLLLLSSCREKVKISPNCAAHIYGKFSRFDIFTETEPGDTITVISGEEIELRPYGRAYDGPVFNWIGPNGFNSQEATPETGPLGLSSEGVYEGTVTENGCSSTGRVYIRVLPATPPCNMAANTARFTAMADMNFTGVSCGNPAGDYDYEIKGRSSTGEVTISFKTATPPNVNMRYRVVGSYTPYSQMEQGDVVVTAVMGGASGTNYIAGPLGTVYVDVKDGKLTATFCKLTFTSKSGTSFEGTGNLTCQ